MNNDASKQATSEEDSMDEQSDRGSLDRTTVPNEAAASSKKVRGKTNSKQKEVARRNRNLSGDIIDAMKVKELREKLKELRLANTGNKNELRQRLKAAEHVDDDEEEDDDEGEEADDGDSDDGGSNEDVDSKCEPEDDEKPRGLKRHAGARKEIIKFTIKDVDNSIPYFTGDDKLPIKKWISDFEELSTLLDWNGLQKLLYGKRMLQGSAKQFIAYEKGVVSWSILKEKLLREFKIETNSAVIHEQLRKRKRGSEGKCAAIRMRHARDRELRIHRR